MLFTGWSLSSARVETSVTANKARPKVTC
jgi:hypothetical protein